MEPFPLCRESVNWNEIVSGGTDASVTLRGSGFFTKVFRCVRCSLKSFDFFCSIWKHFQVVEDMLDGISLR